MGDVYRARDPKLQREVAVKVLPERFGADAERRRYFEKEARAAAALDHPNIITVHDVGVDDGTPFIVTELLEGSTLADALQRGPLARVSDLVVPQKSRPGAQRQEVAPVAMAG